MALKTSVLWTDAIDQGGDGGGVRTYTVNDTSQTAIALSANNNGVQQTFRETKTRRTWRWLGLTETAAFTFWAANTNSSTDDWQVDVRYNCDNHILKSYTAEYSIEWTAIYLVGTQDIPDSTSEPTPPDPEG